VVILFLFAGCGVGGSEVPSFDGDIEGAGADGSRAEDEYLDRSAQDSIFALVRQADASTIFAAFDALRDAAYSRTVVTEQFDRLGQRIAMRSRTEDVSDGRIVVRVADSSGTFDYGYLQRLRFESGGASRPWELPMQIIPDDPVYAEPRTRENYVYRKRVGSLPGFDTVDVIDIRAHPEHGERDPLRRAQLYLEQGSTRQIAQYLERREAALWFREATRVFVSIQPDASGNWIPARVEVETWIRMPFRPLQRFRTETKYSDVRLSGTGMRTTTVSSDQIDEAFVAREAR